MTKRFSFEGPDLVIETGNIQLPDGSAASPSFTFSDQTNLGVYRSGSGRMSFSAGGVSRMNLETTGLTITTGNVLELPDGSATAPTLTFDSDTNMGLYRIGADILGITTNGAERMRVSESNTRFLNQVLIGSGAVDITNTGVDSMVVAEGMYIRGNPSNSTAFFGVADHTTNLYTTRWEADTTTNEWNLIKVSGNDPIINVNGSKVLTLADSVDAATLGGYAASELLRLNGIATQTIDGGTNTTINIQSDDSGESVLNLYGDVQGTGRVFVGQSTGTGGGIEYNGDNSPGSSGAGGDYVTLYRKSGTLAWTARNQVAGNDWEFRAQVNAVNFVATADVHAQTDINFGTSSADAGGRLQFTANGYGATGSDANYLVMTNESGNQLQAMVLGDVGTAGGGTLFALTNNDNVTNTPSVGNEAGWSQRFSIKGNGQVQGVDGSGTVPTYSFATDTNTGFYRLSENIVGVAGTLQIGVGGNRILNQSGSVGSPTYAFGTDGDTGMYNPSAGQLGFAINGVLEARVDSSGLKASNGTAGNPSIAFIDDSNTGLYRIAENELGISTGGSFRVAVTNSSIATTNKLLVDEPAAAQFGDGANGSFGASGVTSLLDSYVEIVAPASGLHDQQSGLVFHHRSTNTSALKVVSLSTTASRFEFTSDDTDYSVRFPDGTAASPGLHFGTDSNTGVYNVAENELGITAGGVQQLRINTSEAVFDKEIVIQGQGSGTIGGATFDNGWLRIGNSSNGITIDPNEIYCTNDMILGTFNTIHRILFRPNATDVMNVGDTEVNMSVPLDMNGNNILNTSFQFADGTSAAPSITFSGDTNTGVYRATTDTLGFTAAGTATVHMDGQGVTALNTTGTSYGVGDNLSAYDVQTPNNASATWLLTHHNDDNTWRSGIQSLNGGNNIRIYTGGGAHMEWSDRFRLSSKGNNASPSHSWTTDPDTGMYSAGDDVISFTAGGTERCRVTTSGFSMQNGAIFAQLGTSAAPAYSFAGDSNTGFYQTASNANTVAWSGGGTVGGTLGGTGIRIINGNAAAPSLSFSNDTNLGIYRVTENELGISSGGNLAASFNTSGIRHGDITGDNYGRFQYKNDTDSYGVSGSAAGMVVTTNENGSQVQAIVLSDTSDSSTANVFAVSVNNSVTGETTGDEAGWNRRFTVAGNGSVKVVPGSAAIPAYTFDGDTDTGLYNQADNQLRITAGGTQVAAFSSAGLGLSGAGSATAPLLFMNGDTNTGMYHYGSDVIGFAAGGNHVARVTANNFVVDGPNGIRNVVGSATTPAYSFSSDVNTGMYGSGADDVYFATAGVQRLAIGTSNINAQMEFRVTKGAGNHAVFSDTADNTINIRFETTAGDTQSGLLSYEASDGNLLEPGYGFILKSGGAVPQNECHLEVEGNAYANSILATFGGSNTSPAFRFSGDADTGMYRPTTNQVALTTGGTQGLRIDAAQEVYLPGISTGSSTDLHINTTTGQLLANTSSIKYKKDVINLDSQDSEFIYNLRCVHYTEKATDHEFDGFIAEEVFELAPSYVPLRDGEPDAVSYSRLVVPVIAELQKTKMENEQLKQRVDTLESELLAIKAHLGL